jgi:hypothetical protein
MHYEGHDTNAPMPPRLAEGEGQNPTDTAREGRTERLNRGAVTMEQAL